MEMVRNVLLTVWRDLIEKRSKDWDKKLLVLVTRHILLLRLEQIITEILP